MTEVTGRVGEHRPRRYPPYPDYKESGVQWLGEVPATWDIAPVYARYEVALGKMLDAKRVTGESSGKYLRNVDVQWDAVNIHGLPEMDFPPSDRNRYLLRPGDLLVCEGGEVGRTAIWRGELDECFYQKAIHRVRPWSACDVPKFFYFLMYAMAKRGVFTAGGNPNTIDHLTAVQLRRYRVPIPAACEQRAIVAFLDRETAKIDALVTRKERLIELLQEKRTALITRAVTRGLDPNVPMKDSGGEWLGQTPAHWEAKKLVYLTSIGNGSTPNRGEVRYWVDGSYPWLTSTKINEGVIVTADEFVTQAALRECHLPRVPAGSILVAITGEGQTRGRTAILSIDSTISQHLAYVTPSGPGVTAGFLVRLFEARYEWLREESSGSGSTRAALTCEFLRSIWWAFPPPGEQQAIATMLDQETAKIADLIAKVHQAIDQLREFRTTLVSAAVTGKIDVRGAAR